MGGGADEGGRGWGEETWQLRQNLLTVVIKIYIGRVFIDTDVLYISQTKNIILPTSFNTLVLVTVV